MLFWAPGAGAQPHCGAHRWNGIAAGEWFGDARRISTRPEPCSSAWRAPFGEWWREKSDGCNAVLLAIDVGNTNIVLGVFGRDRPVESWRLATLAERTADEIGIWVAQLFEHRALDATRITGI